MKRTLRWYIGAAIVLFVVAPGAVRVGTAIAGQHSLGGPSYVNPDGTLNMDKAPYWSKVWIGPGVGPGAAARVGWITKFERWPTPPPFGQHAQPRPIYSRPDTTSPVLAYLP